jgi:GTPase involved in cell partitioning and DNA repair
MKQTPIDSSVLAGQGGGGSWSVTRPNPAPPQGPTGGDGTLSTEVHVGKAPSNGGGLAPKSGDLLPK